MSFASPLGTSGSRGSARWQRRRDWVARPAPRVTRGITVEADTRDSKPCIRGMRITVHDVLGWLARHD
jgi:Protein of unknown function (DUF433)